MKAKIYAVVGLMAATSAGILCVFCLLFLVTLLFRVMWALTGHLL